jgi:hypothetical protein
MCRSTGMEQRAWWSGHESASHQKWGATRLQVVSCTLQPEAYARVSATQPARLDKRHASGVCSALLCCPYMNAPQAARTHGHGWIPLRANKRVRVRTYTCIWMYVCILTSTGGPSVHLHPTFSPDSDEYLGGKKKSYACKIIAEMYGERISEDPPPAQQYPRPAR